MIEELLEKRRPYLEGSGYPSDLRAIDEQITQLLTKSAGTLPVDVIIETLTKLGQAPSVLYDDNGHFAVESDGFQNLLFDADLTKETTFDGSWMIRPNAWKRTIREALQFYLERSDD